MGGAIPVLIVDDNEPDRYLLKRALRGLEFEFDAFELSDGEEAYSFLERYEEQKKTLGERFPPAIIFLDINMPRMDGPEFVEKFAKLRLQHSAYLSIVTLMYTSSQHAVDRDRVMAHEFVTGYIVKGQTSTEELAELVRRALKDR